MVSETFSWVVNWICPPLTDWLWLKVSLCLCWFFANHWVCLLKTGNTLFCKSNSNHIMNGTSILYYISSSRLTSFDMVETAFEIDFDARLVHCFTHVIPLRVCGWQVVTAIYSTTPQLLLSHSPLRQRTQTGKTSLHTTYNHCHLIDWHTLLSEIKVFPIFITPRQLVNLSHLLSL